MRITAVLYLLFFSGSLLLQTDESSRALSAAQESMIADENLFFEDSLHLFEKNINGETPEYQLRKPSDSAIKKLKTDKDLNFAEAEGPSNLFEFISAWINEQIAKLMQSRGFGIFQEYLSYFIAAAAIIIVIIILSKNKLSGIVYGTKDENFHNFRERKEDINELDFDALISSASANKEFRIAARYHYLKSLKLLADKKIIDWQINKTNRQYTHEISNPQLKKSFEELTWLFEWFWYGDYPLEESFFQQAQGIFSNFNGRLETGK